MHAEPLWNGITLSLDCALHSLCVTCTSLVTPFETCKADSRGIQASVLQSSFIVLFPVGFCYNVTPSSQRAILKDDVMGDPLSVAASVAGLLSLGLQSTEYLYTTANLTSFR